MLADHDQVRAILAQLGLEQIVPHTASDRLDRVLLHPVVGPLLLAVLLFLVFQAVFSWAEVPKGWIEAGATWLAEQTSALLPAGWLRSLVVDGVIAGAGGVLVFLPQIVILFFFILVLEESGYLPRAAFLLDRIMGSVGLSGRSFIPAAVEFCLRHPGHHGGAHDCRPARPAGDHHDRAADDLLRAAAGVCAADRRLHPAAAGGGLVRVAGPGAVRPVPGRHCRAPWRWPGCSSASPAPASRCAA